MAQALLAYHRGDLGATLLIRTDVAEPERMPVSIFFRAGADLREVDRQALALARGRVLDAGAGVGSMALLLQDRGLEVTAAEVIPQAVEIMRERGVRDPVQGSLAELSPQGSYDTILLLMNGVALAGTLGAFPRFLRQMGGLLAPGGQLLLDSTDLGTGGDDEDGRYPGEVHFQMEFGGVRGAPFPQLFLDRMTLARIAEMEGWEVEIVWDCDGGEYLARLNRPRHP